MLQFYRFYHPDLGSRLAIRESDTLYDITHKIPSLASWLISSVGRVYEVIQELDTVIHESNSRFRFSDFDHDPSPDVPHLLAPVDEQDVWGAGVTYLRSREARQQEAIDGGDIYARVYMAERPEIFYKAAGRNVVGHRHEVGIRADATWSVPEPEFAVVMNPALEVVGMTIGNDMSSRDIEGANPLYLPQAKIFTASCALGPGIVLQPFDVWPSISIHLDILRKGVIVYSGETSTNQIHRELATLIEYLKRSNQFPNGVILLSGTGIIPPADFTLHEGDIVNITMDGIGHMINRVRIV